jgi:hypothetical protein
VLGWILGVGEGEKEREKRGGEDNNDDGHPDNDWKKRCILDFMVRFVFMSEKCLRLRKLT